MFCLKNRFKKHQIFEKWEHFENRPSCKGYSPCKIFALDQKLKFQKTSQNPFYKSFTVVLCRKPLQKTPNIREMRAFSKSAIMQRQEIIKVREWIPHIGPVTRVIHLNLFLDMVSSSSANFTRALRGQPRRLYTQGHAKLPET